MQGGQLLLTQEASSHTCYKQSKPEGKLLKQQDMLCPTPGVSLSLSDAITCTVTHCLEINTDCMLLKHKSQSDKKQMWNSRDRCMLCALVDTDLSSSFEMIFVIHSILLHPYHQPPVLLRTLPVSFRWDGLEWCLLYHHLLQPLKPPLTLPFTSISHRYYEM